MTPEQEKRLKEFLLLWEDETDACWDEHSLMELAELDIPWLIERLREARRDAILAAYHLKYILGDDGLCEYLDSDKALAVAKDAENDYPEVFNER